MGKTTGFLEYQRCENSSRDVRERIQDFKEFHTTLKDDERTRQAARCMDCGVPLCQSAMKLKGMVTGCPLHNLIPEWNDEIYHGHLRYALSRLLKTASFPEFTGRVCPALCEKACINGMDGESVTIHDNELYIIEKAWANGDMKPHPPAIRSGRRIAVVGSGPAGLAAADRLNKRGHEVTVYEREDRIGGLLMYGIPNMKLSKDVIFRRQKLMEAEGVIFHTGVNVGKDFPAEKLLSGYDAVILCCGAKKARPLNVPEFETTKGIHFAVDFLTSTTRCLIGSSQQMTTSPSLMGILGSYANTAAPYVSDIMYPVPASTLPENGGYISAKGKDVVIVGGGDTGNDCVATCIRHGCRSVTQLEMMPAPPRQRTPQNPWPEWPKVLKTDYGQEEAIELYGHDPRIYNTTVKKLITTKNHHLQAIQTVQLAFKDGKLVEVEGSEQTIKCNLLLIAAGFIGCEDYTAEAFGTARSARGTILTKDGSYRTDKEKVFTAGDMHRGQSLVVWAINEGRQCAREVDEYLMGYTNLV